MVEQIRPLAVLLVLTVLAGFADAQGFIHAGQIWQGRKVVWSELGLSALGFSGGILTYWVTLRYLREYQITAPEIQTLLWFGVTIVGVGLLSGQFARWQRLDQLVALGVVVGIGWLVVRTGG